jgi:hypothetical protein
LVRRLSANDTVRGERRRRRGAGAVMERSPGRWVHGISVTGTRSRTLRNCAPAGDHATPDPARRSSCAGGRYGVGPPAPLRPPERTASRKRSCLPQGILSIRAKRSPPSPGANQHVRVRQAAEVSTTESGSSSTLRISATGKRWTTPSSRRSITFRERALARSPERVSA